MHLFLQNCMTIFSIGGSSSTTMTKEKVDTTTISSSSSSNDHHLSLNLQLYNFFIFNKSYASVHVPSIAQHIYLEK
jgi:hypothetical protein